MDIYYPQHELDSNSVSSGHRGLFLERRPQTTRTQFNHSKFGEQLSEFEATGCSTLLLSSEFFFYQIPEFLKYTEQYTIKFIAYVRADVELIESLYNQSVKRNGQIHPLAPRSQLPKSYLDELTDFVTEFSASPFLLRAYGNSDVFDGDIVSDFLNALKLTPPVETKLQPKKINPSYSFECLEFKRWINRFELGELDHPVDQCLQGYKGNDKAYTLLPEKIYQNYQEQSLNKINSLHALAFISNYEKLIEYVSSKPRAEYIHQELYPEHLRKVGEYLLDKDKALLSQVVSHIKEQKSTSSEDVQYVEMLSNIIDREDQSPRNNPWLKRFISWVRN